MDPRCSKGSVWLDGFCFSKCCTSWCWIVLKMQKYPSDAFRSHHKFMFGQKGRQSSYYSPFTFSGQVWISDIVTLTMFRPCLSSFPRAPFKSHPHFLDHLSFHPHRITVLYLFPTSPYLWKCGSTKVLTNSDVFIPLSFHQQVLNHLRFPSAVSLYLAAN